MRFARLSRWALSLGVVLLSGTMARADFDYTATGAFVTTAGSNVYSQGTATIAYVFPSTTASVTPPSNITLGEFDTTGTTGSTVLIPTSFFLTVTNLDNPFDSVTFAGTLQGTLGGTSSNAFVKFSTPLSQMLDGFEVSIISSSTVNGPGALDIVPPSTSNTTTIQGFVTVPEPSAIALLGLGGSGLVGLGYRRRLAKRLAA